MILMRHAETVFNVVFGSTRRDPGIVDPPLTARGRDQARDAAATLAADGVRRIVASPYSRTLETAEIVAAALGVAVTVSPLVRERAKFSCDVGTTRSELQRRWPDFDFGPFDEIWWSAAEEPPEALHARVGTFCAEMLGQSDWSGTAVITHWGVIRALTGRRIMNCERVRIDPGGVAIRRDQAG